MNYATLFIGFIKDIIYAKSVILSLSKRDIETKYLGSYLGMVWLVLQPSLYVLTIYLVYKIGLRHSISSGEEPYIVYLISGYVIWLFFADTFIAITNSVRQYAFLIKKINFRMSSIPLIKLISTSAPHIFFVSVVVGIAWINGITPSLYTLQIIYYYLATCLFLLGLGWFTASVNVFVKDVSNIVNVIVQFGFWLTPIFWKLDQLPEQYHWIAKVNPILYVVSGYRDSIYNHVFFWDKGVETLYFWGITFVVLLLGSTVFRSLRPQFAEVI